MAERPRRPSSELGSDSSSPTAAKRQRIAGSESGSGAEGEESGESSSAEPGRVKEPESRAAEASGRGEGEGKAKKAEKESESESESESKSIPEEQQQQQQQRLPGVTRSPVASTSRGSEGEVIVGPLQPLALLPAPTSADVGAGEGEGESVQRSLMGEHTLYEELSLIGNGAYGTVYKARDLSSGNFVALKKVRVPITDEGLPTSTVREIAALKQLERFEHPHIVRLMDVCQGSYLNLPSGDERSETVHRGLTLWLVFEHVERDLASFMASCPPPGLSGQTIKQMSKEILLGVDFLHSHRIVHRDLKPQNLLVTSEGHVKIADFGLAKTYDFEMRLTSVVVTLWYRSPEVLLGCPYATPVDIWSVGCILAELSRLEPLFPGTSEGDQLDRIFQVIGTPSQQEWPDDVSLSWTAFGHRRPVPLRSVIPDLTDDGLDLIKKILSFDPHKRLTAAQALNHRYFTAEETS